MEEADRRILFGVGVGVSVSYVLIKFVNWTIGPSLIIGLAAALLSWYLMLRLYGGD